MKKINKFIEKNINKIIAFLYIQPIIDVITGITQNYLHINITISSIIRLVFLLICIYYLIVLDNTKNKNKIYLSLITIYTIIFSIITLVYKDISVLTFEIKNIINVFYLPITLITLISIFEQYKIKINIKHIVYIFLIYIILITIPNITNTGFLSYSQSKIGTVGWFTSANAIGNIISILMPIIILYLIKSKNKILTIITIIISIYAITSMGTKVPLLSLLICLIINYIFYLKKWILEKNKKNILTSILITIVTTITSIIILPKTSFYKNIQIHKEYLGFNSYTEVLTNYELLDHFVFSQRLTFLKNTSSNYKKAHILEKAFGIGYIENYGTENINTKTIEIDYFEILYRNGIIGFIIYFCIITPIIIKSLKIKEKNLKNLELKTSILLILLLALFSGHILITPSVSIFVALILTFTHKGGLNEKTN